MIIHEETTQQLLRGIEEHELDLALISDAPLDPRIEIQQLFPRNSFFVCRRCTHCFGASKWSPTIYRTRNLF
jgi:DNA-binding transcriptional LysR family regulator